MFLRRFLLPVLGSSVLTYLALGVLTGEDIRRVARIPLEIIMAGIAFLALFISIGLLLVGLPIGLLLARGQVRYSASFALLLATGYAAGLAASFLIGGGLRYPLILDTNFLTSGAVCGLITAFAWAALNSDLYVRAGESQRLS